MPELVQITALPPAPSRSDDQATFVAKADAWVAALTQLVAELNAFMAVLPEVMSVVNYNTVSSTSLTVGSGVKTLTVETGKLFQIGQFVIIANTGTPANYMAGQITAYNTATGAMSVNVSSTGGAGTFNTWTVAMTVADALEPIASIAVTGSGADLLNNSVTYSKLQAVGAAKLLGSIGGGNAQEIGLGSGLMFSAGLLAVSGGTATLADGDYGDVVISNSGTTMTVDANSITFAKMQDVSPNILLGRTAGGGDVQEITCTAFARTLLDDGDAATARATLGLTAASLAEYFANTADKFLDTDTVWGAAVAVALTQAATIAVDLASGINFSTTMTGNRTLGNPTNAKAGQSGKIEIKQDTTGGRTLTYGTSWAFAGGTVPTLSTAANARDILYYQVLDDGKIYGSLVKAV